MGLPSSFLLLLLMCTLNRAVEWKTTKLSGWFEEDVVSTTCPSSRKLTVNLDGNQTILLRLSLAEEETLIISNEDDIEDCCDYIDFMQRATVIYCKETTFRLVEGLILDNEGESVFTVDEYKDNDMKGTLKVVNRQYADNQDSCDHDDHSGDDVRLRRGASGAEEKVTHLLPIPQIAKMELALVVDTRLFKKIGITPMVIRYYRIYIHAVNIILAQLRGPRIQISLHSVHILRAAEEAEFITGVENSQIDSAELLLGFSRWLSKANIGRYDHAHLVTGLDLTAATGGSETSGKAWSNSACKVTPNSSGYVPSSSVAEDDAKTYRGVVSSTHQLLHSLGVASHDGQGEVHTLQRTAGQPSGKECETQSFLMSSKMQSGHDLIMISKCSMKQLSFYLSTAAANCLFDEPSSEIPSSSALPGVFVSLPEQCETRANRGYCPDPDITREQKCDQLWCGNATACSSHGVPLDGSQCSVGWFCFRGECVEKIPANAGEMTDWSEYGSCTGNVEFRFRTCTAPRPIGVVEGDCDQQTIQAACGCNPLFACNVELREGFSKAVTTPATKASTTTRAAAATAAATTKAAAATTAATSVATTKAAAGTIAVATTKATEATAATKTTTPTTTTTTTMTATTMRFLIRTTMEHKNDDFLIPPDTTDSSTESRATLCSVTLFLLVAVVATLLL